MGLIPLAPLTKTRAVAFATLGFGALAQLGERLHGMQEVSGSIPLCSTKRFSQSEKREVSAGYSQSECPERGKRPTNNSTVFQRVMLKTSKCHEQMVLQTANADSSFSRRGSRYGKRGTPLSPPPPTQQALHIPCRPPRSPSLHRPEYSPAPACSAPPAWPTPQSRAQAALQPSDYQTAP